MTTTEKRTISSLSEHAAFIDELVNRGAMPQPARLCAQA